MSIGLYILWRTLMASKRMSGEERREQIILIAVELFAAKGFAGVTTREIAAAAGINEATIYKHFASKEDLFDAVIVYYADIVGAKIDETFTSEGDDYRKKMLTTARYFIEFISKDQNIMRIMLYSGLQGHPFAEKYFRAIGQRVFSIIQDAISQAQASGAIRDDIDPRYCSLLFFGVVVYYNLAKKLILKKAFEDIDDGKFLDHLDKVFFSGIQLHSDGDKQ